MKHSFNLLYLFLLAGSVLAQVTPLPNAHAHNDYEHPRPLLDALDRGFTSVEADIHLVNGELYVSHDAPEPARAKTLRELYLEPLRQRTKANGGRVYPDYDKPLLLLVDIKTEAEATYRVLRRQLQEYESLLAYRRNGQVRQGPVQVVLSGNRPVATVAAEKEPLVGIDGRPEDLKKNTPADFMPLISTNYRTLVRWNGQGEIPASELEALKKLARDTHASGRKLRLWATPETETTWRVLLAAGVDYLNTDQLDRLRAFLQKQP